MSVQAVLDAGVCARCNRRYDRHVFYRSRRRCRDGRSYLWSGRCGDPWHQETHKTGDRCPVCTAYGPWMGE